MNSDFFSDVKIIKTDFFEDNRGSFSELYNKKKEDPKNLFPFGDVCSLGFKD